MGGAKRRRGHRLRAHRVGMVWQMALIASVWMVCRVRFGAPPRRQPPLWLLCVCSAASAAADLMMFVAAVEGRTTAALMLLCAGAALACLWVWLERAMPYRAARRPDDDPGGDDGGPGGDDSGPDDDGGPGGGLVNWPAFERDFWAYVRDRHLQPTR